MHHTARPRLPYNPNREFREETGVLVFYDVPPMDWGSRPAPVTEGIASVVDYLENAQERAEERHRMPYKEYLQTEEWKILRRLVIQRAQRRCEWCRRPDQEWNVHHLTYERRGYENLSDLVLLCRDCHAAEHGKTDDHGHAH